MGCRQSIDHQRCFTVVGGTSTMSLAPLYVHNRRDGSRLLSSALVIFCIALTQVHRPWGGALAVISGSVSLYWGFAYRRLDR
ncbi:hypothetical protein KR100_14350 [Synechococcus sp. KORDI-100]|nr:hypothetical protein KR100_14350 [Synechococcus sp. KORDI-100]